MYGSTAATVPGILKMHGEALPMVHCSEPRKRSPSPRHNRGKFRKKEAMTYGAPCSFPQEALGAPGAPDSCPQKTAHALEIAQRFLLVTWFCFNRPLGYSQGNPHQPGPESTPADRPHDQVVHQYTIGSIY
ncbi:hypothetical protein SKAU_G00185920 [Synaphobranchus kaupii]|uniref:Uncharacterized protein n=1 Tax=Synaphobranchus kaupii TaxID=118154 RepID=A0A9Q1FD33_SYNKA|nr:hypothetical protein SKAU_G00185920 [Synaphobranchus kaupii]